MRVNTSLATVILALSTPQVSAPTGRPISFLRGDIDDSGALQIIR
jgi:hypothetical protein